MNSGIKSRWIGCLIRFKVRLIGLIGRIIKLYRQW